MGIEDRRIQYETAGLDIDDLDADPIVQLDRWYHQAESAKVAEPNAMVLSTVDALGHPDSRVVLARAIDKHGITFYTNHESVKGMQISGEPRGAATFAWLDLHRQVRIRGSITKVEDAISDAYFAVRPRASQLGAWASPQSQPIPDRAKLDQLYSDVELRFNNVEVPRPPHWGGFTLSVESIEFWQGKPNRLHDRFLYTHKIVGWQITRLAP